MIKKPKIDLDANYDYKWIVQKVEVKAYEEKVAHEEGVMEELETVEQEHQRQILVDKILNNAPEDSPVRKMFNAAVAKLNSPAPIPTE